MVNVLLFIVGITMGSSGGLFLKAGTSELAAFTPTPAWFISFATNKFIILGFVLYFLPAIIWVYMLSKYPVSLVQPILALTYALTPILALIFLKEQIPLLRWIGIIVIVFGVFLISQSNK